MSASTAVGFWSYAHQDNDADEGRLVRLAERVQAEYQLLTGQEIKIFVDRADLSWGDEWRSRIDEALQQTTFFIAIVTPRYLQSVECRKELLQFTGEATSLGLQMLFLPVIYTPVRELQSREDSDDEIVALIARTQWVDWSGLRLLGEQSSEYRKAVNGLATRLADIAENLQANPPEIPMVTSSDEDDEPGVFDLIGRAEVSMPHWTDTIEQIGSCLERVGELALPMGQRVQESDRAGKGAQGRLAIFKKFAKGLSPEADKMTELGSKYSSELLDIDPAILTIIRLVSENPEEATAEEVEDFFTSIEGMAQSANESMTILRDFSEQLADAGRMSRDLRKPMTKMTAALRAMIDGQTIMDEWVRRINETRHKRMSN